MMAWFVSKYVSVYRLPPLNLQVITFSTITKKGRKRNRRERKEKEKDAKCKWKNKHIRNIKGVGEGRGGKEIPHILEGCEKSLHYYTDHNNKNNNHQENEQLKILPAYK